MATGHGSFAGLIGHLHETGQFAWVAPPAVLALFILLQAEAARVPVDDPLTHLELIGAVAVAVGCVESLVARLRMRWVPPYVWIASGAAVLCMAAVGWGSAS